MVRTLHAVQPYWLKFVQGHVFDSPKARRLMGIQDHEALQDRKDHQKPLSYRNRLYKGKGPSRIRKGFAGLAGPNCPVLIGNLAPHLKCVKQHKIAMLTFLACKSMPHQ